MVEEENNEQTINELFQRQIELRTRTPKDRLVLSPQVDPYYIGTELQQEQARWAQALYNEYVETTGETQIHIRGLHYFIVMLDRDVYASPNSNSQLWTKYENIPNCQDYLIKAVGFARYLNIIPFEGILDKKSHTITITEYEKHITEYDVYKNVKLPFEVPDRNDMDVDLPEVEFPYADFDDWIEKCAEKYAKHLVDGEELFDKHINFNFNLVKPFTIEVWSEKSLPNYIHSILKSKGIDTLVEGSGNLSVTLADDFITRINNRKQNGIILYISDLDTVGYSMPSDISRKLQWFREMGILNHKAYLHPLVITPEQLEDLDINPKAYQLSEDTSGKQAYATRVRRFQERVTTGMIELQALEATPDKYKKLVIAAIDKWITNDAKVNTFIDDAKGELKNKIKKLTKEKLEEHRDELKPLYDDMEKYAKEVDDIMPDNEKIKEQYKEAKDKVFYNAGAEQELENKLGEIKNEIELPEVEPPYMEEDAPFDCLFDSERNSEEQTAILRRRKFLE